MKRALSAVLAPVFAGAFILSACMTPATAQTTSATVVATCGTPPATYSPGANRALTQDTTGTLCSTGSGGGGGGNDAASATGAAVPAKADYQGLNVGGTLRGQTAVNPAGSVYAGQTDLTSVNGVTTLTGAGAVGTGSPRVAVGQDTTTVAGAAPLTTGIYVTGPSAAALATSANQSSVIGTKAAGTAATNSQLTGGVYNSSPPSLSNGQQAATQMTSAGSLKVLDDNSAALLSAATGAIPAGTNAIGTLTGSTAYGLQSAASTNSTSVKGSAGVLKAMNLINTTTTIYYLRMYNLASAPTCSSATGFVRTWPIPPAASSGLAGGIAANLGAGGTTFSTGIAFCLTGGPTSTDNTNAATGVFVNLDFQ